VPDSTVETAGNHRHGLSAEEADRRLAEHGPNELARDEGTSPWRLLWEQVRSPLVLLLLGACVLAGALGEVADAVAIAVIVVLNAVVGFFQEHRAERAVLALRAMAAPHARVIRNGHLVDVVAREVVPGDLLWLEPGDVVAADGSLVEAHELRTGEAALTGESAPVRKGIEPASGKAPLAEQRHRVFFGTSVVRGTGLAEVTETGTDTEMGRIATLLAGVEREPTPLQVRLAALSKTLLWLCLGVVLLVAVLGIARGAPLLEVLLVAVSLAVAAVPEGLPAIVTIALALGVQRMARRHVLVRRLPAVETLGCATVICTDKTGTLTTGEMALRETWGPDERAIVHAVAACNDADFDGKDATGDPTEVALLRAAATAGILRSDIEAEAPRVQVEPFSSETRRMSVLRADGVRYVKGAPEVVLPECGGGTEGAEEAATDMALRALRVLAVAVQPEGQPERLLGLVGLADPPRPEAIEAVARARHAGIRTVMITDDNRHTAEAIAREMGLVGEGEDVSEVVHARATAEDKIRLVEAWKDRDAVVAMTGDGVNDAPALREAHIGVAMGRTGTEVTREASDMVLTDDSFASIVAAIREGRGIYDNIRKVLVYLLGGNVGELGVMLAASLGGMPVPLLPLHLLWINLLTDGLPGLALVTDPPAEGVLDRPPRSASESTLRGRDWAWIALTGLLDGGVTFAVYVVMLPQGERLARTLAFTTLVFCEVLRAFAARSPRRVLWEVGLWSNALLVVVVLGTGLLQIALLEWAPARELFRLAPLSARQVGLAVLLGLIPVTLLEVGKLVRRLFAR